MARATVELGEGRPVTAGDAWGAGVGLFWRYLGLWALLIAAAVAVAVVVGMVVALAIGAVAITDGPVRIMLGALFALVGFVLALALVPVGIGATIVVAYAQRAIAVEDVGPIDALGLGIRLLREHLGESVVLWLINLGLGIGASIVLGVVAVVVAVVLAAVGALIFAATGLAVGTMVYAGLALLALIGVVWVLGGIANTYFWSYWSLAYLRLTGRMAPAAPGQG
jgi:hypothetical protein